MHINIKNHEAHQMAVELSQLTGESITKAVTKSIAKRLKEERAKMIEKRSGMADALMALGQELSKVPTIDDRSPDEILYDEDGLPK